MQFNSWSYILFLAALFAIYYLLNNRPQKWLLVAASYWFYSLWDWRFCLTLFILTAVVYVAGKRIALTESLKIRRIWIVFCLIFSVGILAVFKYFNFFILNLSLLIDAIGLEANRLILQLVAPVGISFYTFRALSYPIDIYRKQLEPSASFLDVTLFVSFFPTLAAGPIERAKNILPQLSARRCFDLNEFEKGCWLIFWGLFKKVFIADNLAFLTDSSFENSATITFPVAYISLIAYAFQIYCDFSGYTDIARGSAKLFGIKLVDNFDFPYLAKNPRDFWKRWHISLSTWLRDYIYIPLGGSRNGEFVTYQNVLITMGLCGLWHGASWNFVLWGIYHGIILIIYAWMTERRDFRLGNGLSIGMMFHFTLLGWLLFRSTRTEIIDGLPSDKSLEQIMEFMGAVTRGFYLDTEFWSLFQRVAFLVVPLVLVEVLMLIYKTKYVLSLPSYIVVPIKVGLLFLFIIYGVQSGDKFIYFKF